MIYFWKKYRKSTESILYRRDIMTQKADLHIHTTASGDALNTPEDVFKKAKEAGLAAVTFTDHDSTLHHQIGRELSKKYGIEFLPGAEVSSSWKGRTAHVLAYFFESVGSSLQVFLDVRSREGARATAIWIIKRMQEMGIDVTLEEYDEVAKNCTTGDSPLLRLTIKKGYVEDIFDYKKKFQKISFEDYTDFSPPIPEVIEEIHKAGGISVLAHPAGVEKSSFYKFGKTDIEKVIEAGIDGLEGYHHSNDKPNQEIYLELAQKHNLLVTGGSDSHGRKEAGSDNEIGSYWCDWELVKSKKGGIDDGTNKKIF